MKFRSTPFLLYVLNSYHVFLALFLLLRALLGSRWWWLGLLNTFALWLLLPLLMLLPLVIALRGKRTLVVSLLFSLIGFLLFFPMPFAHHSDEAQDLRILTFNTWVLNPNIAASVDWILAQDADVIILQEFVYGHESELSRLLEHYPHQSNVDGNVRLFSRHPFIETSTVWLEDPTQYRDGRLAVRAVINVSGRDVTMYGVHLSIPFGSEPRLPIRTGIGLFDFVLAYDESHRNIQIRSLAERVRAETNPVIVAGDFNTSHTSPILSNLRAVGLQDSFQQVGTDWGMTWYFKGFEFPVLRIDYVWSTPELIPLRLERGNYIGSDHLPLVVDFALSEVR